MAVLERPTWATTKDYILIVIGLAIYAFGFTAFILPEKIVIGGLAGVASLIYFATDQMTGHGIPIAISNFSLNIILLLFAFRIVGRTFVVRTVFGTTVISLLIGLMQPLFTEPIVEQQAFMNIIIGAIMCGVGIGMAFVHNGSSGGTDIVAAMVSKRSNITIGRTIMYTDMIIISSSFLLFHSLDKIVYGFVILFIVSFVADQVINTNRQAVQFTIFSRKWKEIADAINNDARRGCTLLDGTGWYTKDEVKILLVMCRKIEQVTIFRIVKSIDKDAFITQANVNGVYGKGFDEMKVKIKTQTTSSHEVITKNIEPNEETNN
ncbi:MAG: YitT family protein [Muribaculaceae bacterium]|nr:YitT family protein [Muribaculaceae bacterium]